MHSWVATVGILIGVSASAAVSAQDAAARSNVPDEFKLDDFCERVREAGKSTAAVLLGPRVALQVVKFPPEGDLALGQTVGSELQFRAYAQYSLTDAYHGALAIELGDAECRRQRLAQPLEDAIRVATDQGRREALAKKLRFLHDNDDVVLASEREAQARQRASVSTISELLEIQTVASVFRAQEAETEDELARLDAAALAEPTEPLSQKATAYERASMDTEQIGSRIRQLLPWGVTLVGGVAAGAFPVSGFGAVELSYNLGGLAQASSEDRLLASRRRELERASYELPVAARAVDEALHRSVEQLKRQAAAVEEEVKDLRAAEASLAKSEAPGGLTLLAVVNLRLLVSQAQLVYLQALAQSRHPWEGP